MIIKIGSFYYIFNKLLTKVLGKYKTKKEALHRLKQIEYFKHKN